MIIEIGSYKFPGFYESIFCNSGEFLDDEDELRFMIEEIIGEGKVDVVYDYEDEDFKKYKIEVGEVFMEEYVKAIIGILPEETVHENEFKFEKVDYSTEIVSPKYYNYRTDDCYCDIDTNWETLQMIKDYTLSLEGVQEYLLEKFSSRDGFISFISNSFDVWKDTDIKDYEQNMLIALLDMLISLTDFTDFEEISYATYYKVDKYYYCRPFIYVKNKEEKKEIERIIKNEFSPNLVIE